jgi:eukaryotic-like serine/threonine-protein kinase
VTPERWQEVKNILAAALDRAPQDRVAYLYRVCTDPSLRREVESLIAAHERGDSSFMEQSAAASGALTNGTKLGPYEILATIGAGGMGEVYQARDCKLGRGVAIKVLPPAFVHDPERLARFQREARILAALNHPNIATIYGLEESDGVHYLVMELVLGQTLAERIHKGPLPVEQALKLACQIADALEAAHEKRVIHRDLKPANVKVTPEGRVKVLDFGLAKAFAADGGLDLSHAPTVTVMGTKEGQLLGTPAYMSPEQARGNPVDKRADVWAFGCVLYEELTGRRAFAGGTVSDTIAAILGRDPDWKALPADLPTQIPDLLRRCLQKDSARRLRDIGDVRIQIDEALDPSRITPGPTVSRTTRPHAIVWSLVALAAISVCVALWSVMRMAQPSTRPIARVIVPLPPTDRLALGDFPTIALAPDGSRLVYVGNRGGSNQLYMRPIDRLEVSAIPGTQGAEGPFFSPDGRSVGFFAEGKLKKVSLSGGAPFTLCSAPTNRGASWGTDDTIVFAPYPNSGLFRVSATGGTPKALTILDHNKGEFSHRWPQILPGGRGVLFTIWTGASFDEARIGLLSLETGAQRILVEEGTYARYIPTGQLVYARAGGLLAVAFDLKRLEVTGPPVSVLEDVRMFPGTGAVDFSASAEGSLAYVPGGARVGNRTLVWVDREGASQPLSAPPRAYTDPRLSPDGQRVAFGIQGTNSGVWLYELARGTLTRSIESGDNTFPIWTPDGKHLTFTSRSTPTGSLNLYWISVDGSGAAESLAMSENAQVPGSWSPDGQVLAFSEENPTTGWDIWVLRLGGDRQRQPLLQTPSNEQAPMFSPDGRWLAYQSDESGRDEVYVRAFPDSAGRSQVSTDGGSGPVWGRNGRELFYQNGDKMMAAAVQTQKSTFVAARPKLLFEGHYETDVYPSYANYDVGLDGQRFLMIKTSEEERAATQINVVLNWFEELKRRVPTGK